MKKKLAEIGNIITGRTPTTSNNVLWGGNVPFITPEDLQTGKRVLKTRRYISKIGAASVNNSIVPANSVCVSCIGNLGYVGITTQHSVTNQQINTIIPNETCLCDYLYYYLKNCNKHFKLRESNSTTVPILNKTDFSQLEIVLPDLTFQHHIASITRKIK